MSFLLSSENVIEYLQSKGLGRSEGKGQSPAIESRISKNFNLLVSYPDRRSQKNNYLLVKQELSGTGEYGQLDNSLAGEWRIHQLITQFPDLSRFRSHLSEAVYFDSDNSIIVMNYFPDYEELGEFYHREQAFPVAIATAMGEILADIHRATLNVSKYRDFLVEEFPGIDRPPNYFVRGLETIRPGIFGKVTKDNLKFFKLYQRYPSFRQAVSELKAAYQPICLVHNDLKLDNILLHRESKVANLRIVDWELFAWGDPAYDLGNLLASYLKIWLGSFLVSGDLEWQIALQLATTPLNSLQPSLTAIVRAYCDRAPEIWQQRPDFLERVVQFIGIALIKRIHRNIDDHEPLTNQSICMLQVAKSLLCEPEKSIPTVFGVERSQLNQLSVMSYQSSGTR
jgi:hypothetical protein